MSFIPKSRSRIRQEASDWVARLGGHGSAEDLAAFVRWRDADPRHAEAYDRVAAIWNQAGQLSRSAPADQLQPHSRSARTPAFKLAMAASLAAAVLVTTLMLGSRWLSSSPPSNERMAFAAAVGEIREIRLPDGSRLTLDSASRVEAAFTNAERRLVLQEGRARFQVAHEQRPFVVLAGSSEVVATGTRFDVSLIGGRTTVLLIEGSVEVRATEDQRKSERLMPGQKLVLAHSAPIERGQANRGDASWPSQMLEFDDSRVEEAVALANRYSRVQLKLDNERIRNLRVSGAFRAGDVASLAGSLSAAFDLRVLRQSDGNLLLVDAGPGDRNSAQ